MSLNATKINLSEIDDILTDLNNRINLIDYRFPQAHSAAQKLLNELRDARRDYDGALQNFEKNPKIAKMAFNSACQAANERVFPILERDLGWGIYLWNIQKKLTSNVLTSGNNSGFFARSPSAPLAPVLPRSRECSETVSEVTPPM